MKVIMNIYLLLNVFLFACEVSSRMLYYTEGEQAEILFHYDITGIDGVYVKMSMQYRGSFYENSQMVSTGLSESQFERYQVKQILNDNILEVSVTILNISREDGGTYICDAYINDIKQDELTKKISLLIEYPPGKPLCNLVSSKETNMVTSVWNIIECVAPLGNMPGKIVCFQDDEVVPPKTDLIYNATAIEQMFWARNGKNVLCCTAGYENDNISKMLCTNLQNGQNNLLYDLTTSDPPRKPSDAFEKGDQDTGNTGHDEFQKCHSDTYTLSIIPEVVVVYLVLIGTIFHIALSILLYRKTRRRLIKDPSSSSSSTDMKITKDTTTRISWDGHHEDDSQKESTLFLRSSARSSSSGIESSSS
ncbi:uncharacterized protein LOC121413238 isoform X1 [Lytechinus variegatus]|uniref:uncharacterized protein LOC121413238 isoform X1 n=1 Tax=Lytechinus variegatus TaxID=7654 RepID=UPI001BB283FC|nr:uncharacterized protein LOC121413238 isoform X1 [Lytechinus variegatus]